MKLSITEEKTIGDVQTAFNHFFPYLKLEFFRSNTGIEEPARVLDPRTSIEDVTFGLQEGSIQLSEHMTMGELEEIFNDRFGLHVIVLGKLGNNCSRVAMPGRWTLKLLNEQTKAISAGVAEKYAVFAD